MPERLSWTSFGLAFVLVDFQNLMVVRQIQVGDIKIQMVIDTAVADDTDSSFLVHNLCFLSVYDIGADNTVCPI